MSKVSKNVKKVVHSKDYLHSLKFDTAVDVQNTTITPTRYGKVSICQLICICATYSLIEL